MRHLTSGSAGRGVDRTKYTLLFPASRAFLAAGGSRPTTDSEFVPTVEQEMQEVVEAE